MVHLNGEADGDLRTVTLMLHPDPESSPDQVDRMSRQLRSELRSLDVEAVDRIDQDEAPEGAKGDPSSWMAMLVTLSTAGGVFTSLVGVVGNWLASHRGTHRISLTIDGDSIELDRASIDERRELIEAFVSRHSPS
jgi:hypothetical protein